MDKNVVSRWMDRWINGQMDNGQVYGEWMDEQIYEQMGGQKYVSMDNGYIYGWVSIQKVGEIYIWVGGSKNGWMNDEQLLMNGQIYEWMNEWKRILDRFVGI